MSIANETPILLDPSLLDADALALLQSVSLTLARHRIPVDYNEADLLRVLDRHIRRGDKIYAVHHYKADKLPIAFQALDPLLLSDLNNKVRLPFWARDTLYPRRKVIRVEDMEKEPLPYAAKVFSDLSSGGGVDVHICKNPSDTAEGRARFSSEKEVLAEEWIPEARVFCVQGAILKDGSYRYIGTSEQICEESGLPRHNWVDAACDPGPQGRDWVALIMNRAAAVGYRGFAGIDMLRDSQGKLWVIDLNFRMCASSPTVLFYPALCREWKRDCWSVRTLEAADKTTLLGALEKGISEKILMPRQIQELPGGRWRTITHVGGSCRAEVEEQVLAFSRLCQAS